MASWIVEFGKPRVLEPSEEIEVSASLQVKFTAERVLLMKGKDRVEVVSLSVGGHDIPLDRDGTAASLIERDGEVKVRVRNKSDVPSRWECVVKGWTA